MKRYFFSLVVFFFSCALPKHVNSQNRQVKVACIGFYNLENLFDTENDSLTHDEEFTPDGSKRWNAELYNDKIDKLATVISRIGIEMNKDGLAILGVSEIENRKVLEDLVQDEKLLDRHYKIVHFNSPDQRGVDVALLYQSKYFTLLTAQPHLLNLLDNNEVKKTRDILLVKGKMENQNLYILVNHWPSRRGGEEASRPWRMEAANLARRLSDSILTKDPEAKIILMGDLNDNPNNQSLLKGLQAKPDTLHLNNQEYFNPFYYDFTKGRGTTAYNDSWSLFDQILLSKNCIKPSAGYIFYKHEIYQRPFMMETHGLYKDYPKRTFSGNVYIGGYSDHFPVCVYFIQKI